MREIKFRAWHNYRKKMYEVQSLDFFWGLVDLQWWEKDKDDREIHRTFQESINGEVDSDMSEEDIVYNSVFGIELMQYTGALDKKGKEIYEGDIVNCSEYGCYGKIYWDEELFSFMFATLCEDGTLFYERFYDYVDDMEIIGNIYENPELLEVSE